MSYISSFLLYSGCHYAYCSIGTLLIDYLRDYWDDSNFQEASIPINTINPKVDILCYFIFYHWFFNWEKIWILPNRQLFLTLWFTSDSSSLIYALREIHVQLKYLWPRSLPFSEAPHMIQHAPELENHYDVLVCLDYKWRIFIRSPAVLQIFSKHETFVSLLS